jgi:cytochrome bd-type quinol oxidase subunit 1
MGGLPVVAAYVLLAVLGVEPTTAGFLALIFLVVLLFGFAYVGARRLELTILASLVEATGAGLLGVLVIAMKALLH